MKTDVQLPTVHSNGTSREMLRDGYDKAAEALFDFREAFGEIEFNARDYYPAGNHAWEAAREVREEMCRRIRDLKDYLDAHREHLYI